MKKYKNRYAVRKDRWQAFTEIEKERMFDLFLGNKQDKQVVKSTVANFYVSKPTKAKNLDKEWGYEAAGRQVGNLKQL